jgi:hypothetical protein
MSTTATSDGIRLELAHLSGRVSALEQRLGQNGAGEAAPFDMASVMVDVRAITQELFPGKCEFTNEFDPEYPQDRYVVVNVEATGDLKEIAQRGVVWHERMRQLSASLFGILRLSIIPR